MSEDIVNTLLKVGFCFNILLLFVVLSAQSVIGKVNLETLNECAACWDQHPNVNPDDLHYHADYEWALQGWTQTKANGEYKGMHPGSFAGTCLAEHGGLMCDGEEVED